MFFQDNLSEYDNSMASMANVSIAENEKIAYWIQTLSV